ncbi:AAEL002984-PA [Aedes aegypti]|uniref:AAEL002984-PA n=1 Tax=Aedes aegypti TaxID=7159 RepID=Q17GG8_AEDAE|nr:AAEL002984-PA [Aedes aegypti]
MKIRSYLRYMIPALPLVPSEVISGAQYSSEGKKHSICLAGVSSGTAAPDKIFPTPTAKSVLLTTSKSIINQCRQKMQETTLSTTLQYRMVQRSVIGNPNIYNGKRANNSSSVGTLLGSAHDSNAEEHSCQPELSQSLSLFSDVNLCVQEYRKKGRSFSRSVGRTVKSGFAAVKIRPGRIPQRLRSFRGRDLCSGVLNIAKRYGRR